MNSSAYCVCVCACAVLLSASYCLQHDNTKAGSARECECCVALNLNRYGRLKALNEWSSLLFPTHGLIAAAVQRGCRRFGRVDLSPGDQCQGHDEDEGMNIKTNDDIRRCLYCPKDCSEGTRAWSCMRPWWSCDTGGKRVKVLYLFLSCPFCLSHCRLSTLIGLILPFRLVPDYPSLGIAFAAALRQYINTSGH